MLQGHGNPVGSGKAGEAPCQIDRVVRFPSYARSHNGTQPQAQGNLVGPGEAREEACQVDRICAWSCNGAPYQAYRRRIAPQDSYGDGWIFL